MRLGSTSLKILAEVVRRRREGLPPPTYRGLARLLGITSLNAIRYQLDRLEKAGLIRVAGSRSRAGGAMARGLTTDYEFFRVKEQNDGELETSLA